MTQPSRKLGWVPSLPNEIRSLREANPKIIAQFPPVKYLGKLPPVYDQGELGSCSANAIGCCFQFAQNKQNLTDFMPSRLFIYYGARLIRGSQDTDAGSGISDSLTVLTKNGVCSEITWPYDIPQFNVKPSSDAYQEALKHQVLSSIKMPVSIKSFKTIINMGYPVAFGFTVFSYMLSDEMASTGILKMPKKSEEILGGHAVVCIGYSDTMKSADGKFTGYLKIRNSWTNAWGQQGNFWMPYQYVYAGYCGDFVVITANENDVNKIAKLSE